MDSKKHHIAEKLMGSSYESMDKATQKVARHFTERKHISKILPGNKTDTTLGQRAADAVTRFGGSWAFIMLFVTTLLIWVILNSYVLVNYNKAFDPYPYILLNLFLSMLASIQAPMILMSQNRQAEKDRLNAEHDYEVNLKAELEIMLLHEKIDLLRTDQWTDLIALQKAQLSLLEKLIEKNLNELGPNKQGAPKQE